MQGAPARLCLYAERCTGSNWVERLLVTNFLIFADPAACPHKHDLDLTVPNAFAALGTDTLVIVLVRNALDWAASLFRHPWHAANHCNLTFPEFLIREWSPGLLAAPGQPPPFCPKYEVWPDARLPMLYERYSAPIDAEPVPAAVPQAALWRRAGSWRRPGLVSGEGGKYAADVLELRAWKARRQVELCQVRRQSLCVRHEDIQNNPTLFLERVQSQFGLQPRPGYPHMVSKYKGGQQEVDYVPFSEFDMLQRGAGAASQYFNATTMAAVRERLDLELESALGYFYTDAFAAALPADPELVATQERTRDASNALLEVAGVLGTAQLNLFRDARATN